MTGLIHVPTLSTEGFVFPRTPPAFVVLCFLSDGYSNLRQNLSVVFICIFMMAKGVEGFYFAVVWFGLVFQGKASLRSPGYPGTERSTCLCILSVGIKGVALPHPAQDIDFFQAFTGHLYVFVGESI